MPDIALIPPTQTVVGNAPPRAIQANELAEGPAKARILVVLVGDPQPKRSQGKPGDEKAFQRILAAGFKRRSTQEPPSCCIQDDTGTLADFDHVVDHIFNKSGRRSALFPRRSWGRTKANGVFRSDHAGVFSALLVPRKPVRRHG